MPKNSEEGHKKMTSRPTKLLSVLPDHLLKLPRYLLWKYERVLGRPKPVKAPYYVNGKMRKGVLDTEADLAQLVTLDEAIDAFMLGDYDGIGLALSGDKVAAFDIDNCLNPDGSLDPDHAGYELVLKAKEAGAYIEVSPSGRGLRIVGPCESVTPYSRNQVEFWGWKRYVTLTGDVWANPKGWVSLDTMRGLFGPTSTQVETDFDEEQIITPKTRRAIQSALDVIDSDNRELWIKVGMALKTIGPKGEAMWLEWSAKSDKFEEEAALNVWEGLNPERTNYKAILAEARDNWGWKNKPDKKSLEEEDDDEDDLADRSETRRVLLGEFKLAPTEFVLDGFLPIGVSVIAGAWGAGKTTNLIPLLAAAAHLTPDEWGFRPALRRKVIWISEDVHQARDTLYSIAKKEGISWDEIGEWFLLFKAVRTEPKKLAKFIAQLVEENTTQAVNGYVIKPVVTLDTVSANLDLENESDNSEVANAMSQLKQRLPGVPLVLVGHTPKAVARADLANTTFRGAGAWEAEAAATYYLIHDEEVGMRYLAIRKCRFGPDYREVSFDHEPGREIIDTPWDEPQSKGYLHGVPSRSNGEERKAAKEEAREEKKEQRKEKVFSDRQQRILDRLNFLVGNHFLPTRGQVLRGVGGNKDLVYEAINRLIEADQFEEHEIDRSYFGAGLKGPTPTILLPVGVDVDLFLEAHEARKQETEKEDQ